MSERPETAVPPESAKPQAAVPRQRFSYSEIKIFELAANLIVAGVLMLLIVTLTIVIALLRRP